MGSAKWLIFILLAGTLTSILVGVADMNYLGPNADQSPMFKIFQVFGITSSESGFGTTVLLAWSDPVGILDSFVRALFFEYSVLVHSAFGNLVRWLVLIPLSVAVLFSLGLMLWTHVPIIGRGSQ